ncbi:hypothetical protein P3S67_025082 [Capsicum chacoense]
MLVNPWLFLLDYYIVASTRFTKPILTVTAILHYQGSNIPASKPLPVGPTYQVQWSMKQARTISMELDSKLNAARPNPQGAFHYTPLKLADNFKIPGVFQPNKIKDNPPHGPMVLDTSVFNFTLHDFVEIVFQNNENVTTFSLITLMAMIFGLSVVYGFGLWNTRMRRKYNLVDATTRCTIQVYPNSWSAILVALDNKGMWNLRSAIWQRRYFRTGNIFQSVE